MKIETKKSKRSACLAIIAVTLVGLMHGAIAKADDEIDLILKYADGIKAVKPVEIIPSGISLRVTPVITVSAICLGTAQNTFVAMGLGRAIVRSNTAGHFTGSISLSNPLASRFSSSVDFDLVRRTDGMVVSLVEGRMQDFGDLTLRSPELSARSSVISGFEQRLPENTYIFVRSGGGVADSLRCALNWVDGIPLNVG